MRRREFIGLAGSAAALPLVARAQQAAIKIVGFLGANTPAAAGHLATAFAKRLNELGWVEGQNLKIEYRWAAGQTARFQEVAAELVTVGADVIVTSGNASAIAARKRIELLRELLPNPRALRSWLMVPTPPPNSS